jgi:hypothetical protein
MPASWTYSGSSAHRLILAQQAPSRAVSAAIAVRHLLPGSSAVPSCDPACPDHFGGYLTVYNTVLLVSSFPRPTVTVTASPVPRKRTDPVTRNALSDDENGAG